jgi:hypothetical protein
MIKIFSSGFTIVKVFSSGSITMKIYLYLSQSYNQVLPCSCIVNSPWDKQEANKKS